MNPVRSAECGMRSAARPWFAGQLRVARLEAAAAAWVGTPFRAHGALQGAGVDCVHLVAGIYLEVGFLSGVDFPHYSMDGGSHKAVSQLEGWLDGQAGFKRLEIPQWAVRNTLPGDAICLRLRRTSHHVALKLSGTRIIHCMAGREVMESDLADPAYARILQAVYRPMEATTENAT